MRKMAVFLQTQVPSSRILQSLVQEVLGFFPFHARNLFFCSPARCAIPVYVLGEMQLMSDSLADAPRLFEV